MWRRGDDVAQTGLLTGSGVSARLFFGRTFFRLALFPVFLGIGLCRVWHNAIHRNMRHVNRHTHHINRRFGDTAGEEDGDE